MSAHNSNSPDLSLADLYDAVLPLPANRYHLKQLLRDVSKVIESAEDCRSVLLAETFFLQGLLKRSESGRPLAARDFSVNDLQDLPRHPIPTKEIELYKQFSMAASQKLRVARNLWKRYGEMSDQIRQPDHSVQAEELGTLLDLGKEIIEYTDDGLYEPFRELRRRVWDQLGLLDQEAPSQPSHSAPEDDIALQNQRIEILKSLPSSQQKAYRSYKLMENVFPTNLTDREVYEHLKTDDFSTVNHEDYLHDYDLPSFDTWSRHLRKARQELGEQKNHIRRGRTTGRSIIGADAI